MDCLAQPFTIQVDCYENGNQNSSWALYGIKRIEEIWKPAFNIQSKNAIETLIDKFQQLCKSINLSKKASDIFILIANMKLLKRKSYFAYSIRITIMPI
jgi:hypothetical protein